MEERETEFESARVERQRALQHEHEERARAHMQSLQTGTAVGEAAQALDSAGTGPLSGTPRIGSKVPKIRTNRPPTDAARDQKAGMAGEAPDTSEEEGNGGSTKASKSNTRSRDPKHKQKHSGQENELYLKKKLNK